MPGRGVDSPLRARDAVLPMDETQEQAGLGGQAEAVERGEVKIGFGGT